MAAEFMDPTGSDVLSRISVIDAEGREMNGMLGLTELLERYTGGLGSSVQRVGPCPRASTKSTPTPRTGSTRVARSPCVDSRSAKCGCV